ncbi:hypothetical protein [Paenibacillus sp. FSL H7-0331]|uniref:hypothetical protein n=1 Tax=Paenibacillus sp. FSL H7-0331 TaxID=1920421 RepID=UPI00096DE731|nr:hypothetical protein [Paenibacillus sp. FSL H7-0331]OMF10795.1 hypothetical protein BK127_26725 [Paenibacillus sp. FSL H7-0331]
MGYELNITRAKYTFEAKENPITLEEWKNYISNDVDLKLQVEDDISQTLPNGNVLSMKSGEGMASWDYNGETVFLRYSRGLILAPFHPYGDEPQYIEKLKSISNKLNARLLGDEQEEY